MFVIGDIHGELKLLQGIYDNIKGFNEPIYSVGDIVDRGLHPIECIKFLKDNNILPVMGNHEKMMLDVITPEQSIYKKRMSNLWMQNGGFTTLSKFNELSKEEQDEIYDYVKNLPLYYWLKEENILILHAGLNYNNKQSIEDAIQNIEYDDDFLWYRYKYLENNDFRDLDTIIVSGHTPFKEIIKDENRYFIDTGAFRTGRLSCLRITNNKIEGYSYTELDGFVQQFTTKRTR